MATHLSAPGVHIAETPVAAHPIEPAPTAVTAFVGHTADGPVQQPVAVDSASAFERVFGRRSADSPLSLAVGSFFDNGGQQALVVRLPPGATAQTAWVPTDKAARQRREGVYALDEADFNLLCLLPPPGHDLRARTWARAAAYCRQRRAVLIVDALADWQDTPTTANGMTALRGATGPLAAAHAAVYHPRLQIPDPRNRKATLDVAPCGAVAGVIARTDAQHGVWKAPAGQEARLAGVTGLTRSLDRTALETLNPQGLNILQTQPGQGPVVWGARTLAGTDTDASDWQYLPVRRLALHIERSVLRGTDWVVFEPNDETLWARLRAAVGDFLFDLFRRGAFQGGHPGQAYLVRCDRSTMSADDIAHGRVQLLIGFAPLKPGEFVTVRLTLRSAG